MLHKAQIVRPGTLKNNWIHACVIFDIFLTEDLGFLKLFALVWKQDPEFAKESTFFWCPRAHSVSGVSPTSCLVTSSTSLGPSSTLLQLPSSSLSSSSLQPVSQPLLWFLPVFPVKEFVCRVFPDPNLESKNKGCSMLYRRCLKGRYT